MPYNMPSAGWNKIPQQPYKHTPAVKEGNEWVVANPAKCVKNCDHAARIPKHQIVIAQSLWQVIQAMTVRFPHDEWQMLLTGVITDNRCYCDGYFIPAQEVSGARVYHKDTITDDVIAMRRIVAGIHSHVNMQTTPSQMDIDDSVMSLIDYHLIVNNRFDLNAMRKGTLPCNELALLPCSVVVEGLVDLTTLVIDGIDKIKKKTYEYQYDNTKNWTDTRYKGGALALPNVAESRDYDDDDREYVNSAITNEMLRTGMY